MTAIQIYDEQELVHIAFDDIRKYHGAKEMASVGVAYRMAEAAFEALYGMDVPERQELSIQAGQGGRGIPRCLRIHHKSRNARKILRRSRLSRCQVRSLHEKFLCIHFFAGHR